MDIKEVLTERGSKYGNYLAQTTISSDLKFIITNQENFELMAPDQQDCLEMITVKISRILNGDPNYSDNWRDIAGYATLVADRLDRITI